MLARGRTIQRMDRTVVVATTPDIAYDRVLGDPLPAFFDRGHLLLPAIAGTQELVGTARWGSEVGQARRIVLADDTSMVETLQRVEPGRLAAYTMSDLTGPFAALYDGVLGEWTFAPHAGGTLVTWRWRLRPHGVAGRLAVPIIARMWQGYAAKALARIRQHLDATPR